MRTRENYTEYKRLIENTVIPETFSEDIKSKSYNQINGVVRQMLPSKLYRFRSCSERCMEAFYRDELWFSNGSVMNDDFDVRMYFDKKQIMRWIDSFIEEDGCLRAIDEILIADRIPAELVALIPNAENIFAELKQMSREQIRNMSTNFLNFIKSNLDSSLKEITQIVQSQTKFACFSEKIYSDMMWGQYADNAKGFALEYEFGADNTIIYKDPVKNQNIVYGRLFPIIYGNYRLDATSYAVYLFQARLLSDVANIKGMPWINQYIRCIVACPDEYMATKLAIKKSSDWKEEKEWRMCYTACDADSANQQHSYVLQKPSALYLGRKISPFNQKILVDIAKEKNIPVYKMDFNDNARTYRLRKYKLKI